MARATELYGLESSFPTGSCECLVVLRVPEIADLVNR